MLDLVCLLFALLFIAGGIYALDRLLNAPFEGFPEPPDPDTWVPITRWAYTLPCGHDHVELDLDWSPPDPFPCPECGRSAPLSEVSIRPHRFPVPPNLARPPEPL